MTDLADLARLVPLEHGLAEAVTLRPDGSAHASVVNLGVLAHPLTGEDVVGFVTRGETRKLVHLRADPRLTVVIRAGWQWAAADGTAELVGPDDPRPGIGAERLRLLRREVFSAAGGEHDDWDAYDRVMADERRAVVLLVPRRCYSSARRR